MEDTLIDGLAFKHAKTASYIANRRGCIFQPHASNNYSSNVGVKLVKITIAGHDLLDLQHVVYFMT